MKQFNSLKYWNECVTVIGIEIDHDLLGTEFVIEDGKITEVIEKNE